MHQQTKPQRKLVILVKTVLLEIVQFLSEKEHIPVFCTECCYSVRHQLIKNLEAVLRFAAVCRAELSGMVTSVWQEEERNELDFPGQSSAGGGCVCVCVSVCLCVRLCVHTRVRVVIRHRGERFKVPIECSTVLYAL